MRFLPIPFLLLPLMACGAPSTGVLDPQVRQLLVGIAPDWDATKGHLQRFERAQNGRWEPVGGAVPVLFGGAGLAWGRGVRGQDEPGLQKREKDKRAPAGIFKIGKVYGYEPALPRGSAGYPYHQVSPWDAWVDDPALPQYNRHVRVDPADPPPWFKRQRMRHGDFAYHWLVEVRHNADPPKPGAGSAIFLHIRRGPTRPSAGCTTMKREDLETIIRWLRADQHPHYALLPREEYARRWKPWGLPPPPAK